MRLAVSSIVLLASILYVAPTQELNSVGIAKECAAKIGHDAQYVGAVPAEVTSLDLAEKTIEVMFDGPVNAEKDAAGVQVPEGTTLKLTFSTTGVVIPPQLALGDQVSVYWGRSPPASLPKDGWITWKIDNATGQLMAFKTTKGLLYDPEGTGRWNFIPLVIEKRAGGNKRTDDDKGIANAEMTDAAWGSWLGSLSKEDLARIQTLLGQLGYVPPSTVSGTPAIASSLKQFREHHYALDLPHSPESLVAHLEFACKPFEVTYAGQSAPTTVNTIANYRVGFTRQCGFSFVIGGCRPAVTEKQIKDIRSMVRQLLAKLAMGQLVEMHMREDGQAMASSAVPVDKTTDDQVITNYLWCRELNVPTVAGLTGKASGNMTRYFDNDQFIVSDQEPLSSVANGETVLTSKKLRAIGLMLPVGDPVYVEWQFELSGAVVVGNDGKPNPGLLEHLVPYEKVLITGTTDKCQKIQFYRD